NPRPHSAGFSAGISPWTYLLNQTVMIVRYLRLTIWPHALVLNYGWPRSLTLADVWPSALFVVALGLATLVALWRLPPIGFVGAWFFITLAPTSSLVPIATEVGAERRMYLPLVALVTCAVATIAVWLDRRLDIRRAGAALLAAVVVVLATATWFRNAEYASAF